ncbi:vWA domain-containing protein [Rhodococcus sp. NPDC054953]
MRARSGAAVGVLAALLGSFALITPFAAAQPAPSAVGDFGACLAARQEGDVLLVIDESASLQASDPDAARVSAAGYLVDRLASFVDSAGVSLNVAVAGFSEDFTLHAGWTDLTDATLATVQGSVDAFTDRATGIDTDYRNALDGARSTLAERGRAADGGSRCQAVAWFSDGKLDYTPRDAEKPYAPGVSLATDAGVGQVIEKAAESLCRPGGVADQLRSSGVTTFGVGLAAGTAHPSDFGLMRAIATGDDPEAGACGAVTTPRPGDFYVAQNIDDLLFAFDALSTPGQAPLVQDRGVCAREICDDAQHRFVLDNSIASVTVLGFADREGLVPTLVSPNGDALALPRDGAAGPVQARVGGADVTYEWLSPRSVSVSMRSADSVRWQGMWAVAFVDPDGSRPDARSKSNVHITGGLFPAWLGSSGAVVRSGDTESDLHFGVVDADRSEIDPTTLQGTASLSASLTDSAGVTRQLADGVPKDRIGESRKLDLTDVPPGPATLRLTLDVTTAAARSPEGTVIAPGTTLAPQSVDIPLTVAPPNGYPTVAPRIDFGTVEGAGPFAGELLVEGKGCVWLEPGTPARIDSAPDGTGAPRLTGSAASAADCRQVADGERAALPVELAVDAAGNGPVNGSVQVMVAPEGEPDRAMPVDVPFTAELRKPIDAGRFGLIFVLALVASVLIPLGLLWLLKWRNARISQETLKAQRFDVTIRDGEVLRDGESVFVSEHGWTIAPGLGKPTRGISLAGVDLQTRTGLSPFGSGAVTATVAGRVCASSTSGVPDRNGRATLPLAVRNTWIVAHDPMGPADLATVVVLAGGDTGPEARDRLVTGLRDRLPGVVRGIRDRADRGPASGSTTPAAPTAPATAYDPFGPAPSSPAPSGPAAPAAPAGVAPAAPEALPFDPFRPPTP